MREDLHEDHQPHHRREEHAHVDLVVVVEAVAVAAAAHRDEEKKTEHHVEVQTVHLPRHLRVHAVVFPRCKGVLALVIPRVEQDLVHQHDQEPREVEHAEVNDKPHRLLPLHIPLIQPVVAREAARHPQPPPKAHLPWDALTVNRWSL